MKTESNLQPTVPFKINVLSNGMSEVMFFENVNHDDKRECFLYDMYLLTVPSRETLQSDIEENYSKWLNFAKAQEEDTPTLSKSEQIAALCAENERLRVENEITANALDELIQVVYGGEV